MVPLTAEIFRPPDYLVSVSLTIRIFLSAAFVVAAALGATLAAAGRSADMTAEATVTKALTDALDQVDTQLEERRSALTGQAEVFAKDPDFRAIVEQKKPVDLRSEAQDAATQVGANWVQITTAAGIRIAKSNDPRADTIDISGSPFVAGALAGASKRGYAVDRGTLIQVAAVPIFATAQNQVTGVLMAARSLDSAFAASLKMAGGPGVNVALFAFDTLDHADVVASTIGSSADLARRIGSLTKSPAPDPARPDSLRRETATNLDIAVGGTNFAALAGPLRSASGEQVGGFIVLRDKDVELAAFNQLKVVILGIGALSLFMAALLSFAIARGVTRPVAQLVDAANRAADGDYSGDIDHKSRGKMRALSSAFRSVLADLRGRQELTELIAVDAGTARGVVPPRGVADAGTHGGVAPGQRFAQRYDILEVRGAGGSGTVLKALDGQLGAVVAIKTLTRDVLGNDAGALERFKSEIRLARRISHRNVVRTHDLGEFSGAYFVTMEYVEGTTLEELLRRRGRLPIAAAITVGRQLCRALEAAHTEGVVHGAIKARNIVVAPGGVLKVMDFGIAPHASDEPGDVRAAASVIYECLTGSAALTGEGGPAPAVTGTDATPETPVSRNPEVPRALSELVMRTLFAKPAKRPQTARELHDLLAAIS